MAVPDCPHTPPCESAHDFVFDVLIYCPVHRDEPMEWHYCHYRCPICHVTEGQAMRGGRLTTEQAERS